MSGIKKDRQEITIARATGHDSEYGVDWLLTLRNNAAQSTIVELTHGDLIALTTQALTNVGDALEAKKP